MKTVLKIRLILFSAFVLIQCKTGSVFEKTQLPSITDTELLFPVPRPLKTKIKILGFKPVLMVTEIGYNFLGLLPGFPGVDDYSIAQPQANIQGEYYSHRRLRKDIMEGLLEHRNLYGYECLTETLPDDPVGYVEQYDAVVIMTLMNHKTAHRTKTYYVYPLSCFVWILPFASPELLYYESEVKLTIYKKSNKSITERLIQVKTYRERSFYSFAWFTGALWGDSVHNSRMTAKIIEALYAIYSCSTKFCRRAQTFLGLR